MPHFLKTSQPNLYMFGVTVAFMPYRKQYITNKINQTFVHQNHGKIEYV